MQKQLLLTAILGAGLAVGACGSESNGGANPPGSGTAGGSSQAGNATNAGGSAVAGNAGVSNGTGGGSASGGSGPNGGGNGPGGGVAGSVIGGAGIGGTTVGNPTDPEPPRRPPLAGMYDWSHAGYRGGMPLPTSKEVLSTLNATDFGVVADDMKDDSAALQAAIDKVATIAGRDYTHLVVLQLPAGRIDLSEEIKVDQSYLIIRGVGSDIAAPSSTRIVVRPSTKLRIEKLTEDKSAPGWDDITEGDASGGWIWPGHGVFRVQTRAVHSTYASAYASAPANHKELFEGSINYHWKSGLKVAQTSPIVAKQGDKVIKLDSVAGISAGQTVWVGAANSKKFYDDTGVTQTEYQLNGHMRAQVFTAVSVDTAGKSVTLDKPLEFDVPANNTSDGSPSIAGTAYYSKVMPVTVVQGVGFEDFYMTCDLQGLPRLSGEAISLTREQAKDEYGNLAPEYAIHGIIFKWAENAWVRKVHLDMTGSHPIVTEVARHLQVEYNVLTGAWNKGKGGNGYLRGSRVWDSLYRENVLRDLRHFTFQWSASGNVATHNDVDCDFNLHGGWERNNLIERNTGHVSYGHRSGSCTVNCGDEGTGTDVDNGQWFPLWWAAGNKAGKWSGASGPRNLLFNNSFDKQTAAGAAFTPYAPYAAQAETSPRRILQIGWGRSGGGYQALSLGTTMIADWSGNETVDFSMAPNLGVDASATLAGTSVFYDQ